MTFYEEHSPYQSDSGESAGCGIGCVILSAVAAIVVLIATVGYCSTLETEEPQSASYEYNQQSFTSLAGSKPIAPESWSGE